PPPLPVPAPAERVELCLELVHAPRRRWFAEQVQLLRDPVGPGVAAADAQALGQDTQAVLEIVERFPRHSTCNVPARNVKEPDAYGLSAGLLRPHKPVSR